VTAFTEKFSGLFGRIKRAEQEVPHMEDPGKDSRSASGLPIVPAFDGFRAFAIMSVVALHLLTIEQYASDGNESIQAILVWGFLGRAVEVLFVVSGFVVFLPTVARMGDFGSVGPYALRRAARLAPAYWLALVITIILVFLMPGFDNPTWVGSIGHVFFLQTPMLWIDQNLEPGFRLNPPLWTLSIEVGFYVVLPFIARWYARHPLIGLAIAGAITVGWQRFLTELPRLVEALGFDPGLQTSLGGINQLPAWALSFASGMTAAWAYVQLTKSGRPPGSEFQRGAAALGCLILFAGFGIWAGIDGVSTHALLSYAYQPPLLSVGFSLVLGATMLAITVAPRWIQRPFANTPVRKLGDISYGIYLSHFILIAIALNLLDFGQVPDLSHLAKLTLFVVPIAILYGYLSARFVEQPIRRWAHRFGARAQGGQAPRKSA